MTPEKGGYKLRTEGGTGSHHQRAQGGRGELPLGGEGERPPWKRRKRGGRPQEEEGGGVDLGRHRCEPGETQVFTLEDTRPLTL